MRALVELSVDGAMPQSLIQPHGGGALVDRQANEKQAEQIRVQYHQHPSVLLSPAQLADLEMLAVGAMTPLQGFMGHGAYQSVLERMCLPDGTLWPIPITLGLTEAQAKNLKPGMHVRLCQTPETWLGLLEITEIYPRDLDIEAQTVYGTTDKNHPGVAALHRAGPYCAAGPIQTLQPQVAGHFGEQAQTPAQTRAFFTQKGWRRIVGFQTRNPIHRAHEYIIKCALESVDGLLLHPLVGATKADDIPADVRLACYKALMQHHMSKDFVHLSVLPAAMRYAGPKEAILHAIMRQNYGCSHFIVGRDHAGVGNYYDTYAAQRIFENLPAPLAIVPLAFDNAFFCRLCNQMATKKTCPHPQDAHVQLSGTQVRQMLAQGQIPPVEFTRPQVAQVLMQWMKKT